MIPPFDPIILTLGPFGIRWYGLLIVTGIMLGAAAAAFIAQEQDKDPDHIWDMLLLAVFLAIVGARMYHVFSKPSGGLLGWDHYKANPIEVFYLWEGGLGIFGAIIGGALGVLIYCLWHKLRPLRWMDFTAPGLALGQSIGRWGNYMNRELYGPPTNLPWGLEIPQNHRIIPYTDMNQYPPETLFHPTFLYESLAALALFLILFWIGAKHYRRLKEGDLLISYLIGYATIRFFTEMLRPDAWTIGKLAAAQIFSLIFIIGGIIALVVRHCFARQTVKSA